MIRSMKVIERSLAWDLPCIDTEDVLHDAIDTCNKAFLHGCQ